jgi:hypothetical protein
MARGGDERASHGPVRYRFLGLLGQGTFSQIIRAEDTFHPSRKQASQRMPCYCRRDAVRVWTTASLFVYGGD